MATTVNSSNKPRQRVSSCAPSNHAGAFRCSRHHNQQQTSVVVVLRNTNSTTQHYSRNSRLRSAEGKGYFA
ncbi:hypothetical protein MKW94_023585 [Papaver nudicaule]|uniref:Uncharacterized protein n=1 Tax=Papaver nudicaule TaxID=74823 RepID=A0AA41S356_PAPNU|nr:hypothetical protein [Papaver nudicaule]